MEARLLLVRDAVGVLEGKERARDKLLLPEEGGRAHQAAQTARDACCVARQKAARLPSKSWYIWRQIVKEYRQEESLPLGYDENPSHGRPIKHNADSVGSIPMVGRSISGNPPDRRAARGHRMFQHRVARVGCTTTRQRARARTAAPCSRTPNGFHNGPDTCNGHGAGSPPHCRLGERPRDIGRPH